jgi:hypothetical protein
MEPDAARQREQAHMLLDAVPDNKIPAVRNLLETIVSPLSRALANAPLDDEPLSDEMAAELAAARASLERGEGISHEEILREFGLSAEDWEQMGRTPLETAPHSPRR